jgi:electron transfer flavoprotein beta subunit
MNGEWKRRNALLSRLPPLASRLTDMHIAVLVKQVANPEVAASQFRIDDVAKVVEPMAGVPLLMSPFDEQAVEAALRIRDAHAGTRITVITLGPESARNVLKHGLALGADDGVLLSDAAYQGGDGHATAVALSAALRKLGTVDLVLAGRQAADDDAGVVGIAIAQLLDMPAVSYAQDVQIADQRVRVERVLDDGIEVVEAPLPALVTVSNELGEPRKPNLRETMRAARKPVAVWSPADLALDATGIGRAGARATTERVYAPVKESRCEQISGASPAEQAAQLAAKLREAKLI